MKITKELLINIGLAFIAGAAASFGALVATTPKDDLKAFVIAVVSGLIWAGVRAAAGFISLNTQVPTIPVDE